jgi:predicted pyridoxine 5'-phosphate oxidase superfamily flavin-nucleotide-binding protein
VSQSVVGLAMLAELTIQKLLLHEREVTATMCSARQPDSLSDRERDEVVMDDPFHLGQRVYQDRFDTRRLADTLAANPLYGPEIDEAARRLIEAADMFFLATADERGLPDCSYKGGDPGFVRVLDERTLAFPSYDGNGIFASLGNIHVNPQVGILFVDFERGHRLRLRGEASVHREDSLLAGYPGAHLIVRVATTLVYPNCKRYVHRMRRVERSRFVPREGVSTPVPSWKREEWVPASALPHDDPARDPGSFELPATPDY